MKLVKGNSWAKQCFEKGSRPTEKTLCQWIEKEEIPGKIIAGKPYVDATAFEIRTVQKTSVPGAALLD